MSKKRNIAGLTVLVSNETYNEYKGTLQEQIEQLQQENKQLKERINDVIDYINKDKQIESTYKCSVDGITREFNTYKLYCEPSELLAILGDKE